MANTILKLSNYKMECSEINNLASDYLDNELAEIIQFSVKKHASECYGCSNMLEEVSQLIIWASELGDCPLPNAVSDRLRAKLRSL